MGFVKFASDYAADQAAMQAEADGLQEIVLRSSAIGPAIAGPWADFYKQLTAFDATPVYDVWRPFLPDPHFIATSGLADTFASQAAALEGWRKQITAASGDDLPGFTDPTGQQAANNLVSFAKWGAMGLAAIGGTVVALYALGEVGPVIRVLAKRKGKR